MEEKIKATKGAFDWFLKKDNKSMVIILLILIIGYLGYKYYLNNEKTEKDLIEMKQQINDCLSKDKRIRELESEIDKLKMKFVLIEANATHSPNAQWITDSTTGIVLWVNKAYIKKYLEPSGFSANDLIGTDGSHIFGDENSLKFIDNNNWVIRNKKHRTFKEVEWTLKYPLTIGNYVFAVAGMEYERYD